MESRSHALAAGIFTLLFVFATALAVWWLSGKREVTNDYVLYTKKNVTGLNPQAQVRYRGMRSGKVLDISLDPKDSSNILVTVSVDADMPITKSTTASLGYQGVTGLAFILLEDTGTSKEPLEGVGDELPRIALKGSAMDGIVEAALDTVLKVQKLADRAGVLLSDDNVKRVNHAIANVEGATTGLDSTMKDAAQVMAALKKTLSDENLKRINAIVANLEKTSGETAPLAAELRGLVANLQSLSKRLDETTASAGGELVTNTLPRANKLMEELSSNSHQLSRVLEEIEKRPQSLIFGRPAPIPGPGEPGFSAPAGSGTSR